MKTPKIPIACRRPRVGERFRVYPGGERRAATWVAYEPNTGDPHLVAEYLWKDTAGLVPTCLRACVNDGGEQFVWAIAVGPPPAACSGPNVELLMADTAESLWCRLRPAWGSFETLAPGSIPEPAWAGFDFLALLHGAFGDRVIASVDHPVLVALREDHER